REKQEVRRLELATGRLVGRAAVSARQSADAFDDRAGFAHAVPWIAALSAEDDRVAKVWELGAGEPAAATTARERASFRGHTAPITSLTLSADGNRLASAAWDNARPGAPAEIKVWDVATGRDLLTLAPGGPGPVLHLAFDATGRHLAGGGRD